MLRKHIRFRGRGRKDAAETFPVFFRGSGNGVTEEGEKRMVAGPGGLVL